MNVVPVILAGGIGERFWPLSRSTRPKQLLAIVSRRTMAEETLERTKRICSRGARPLIITSKQIAPKLHTVVSRRFSCDILVEPIAKNTAPAVALAASWIERKYGESVMVVLSVDHDIRPKVSFEKAVRSAITLASKHNNLIVFGIKPGRVETGYGYIELGDEIGRDGDVCSCNVKRFVEKPDLKQAAEYIKAGNFMWNSGIFVWKTSVILDEFRKFMPDLHTQVSRAKREKFSKSAIYRYYAGCSKESIDYGIMEKSSRVSAVVGTFQWDDIGSWEAISRVRGRNSVGTTLDGKRIFEKESSDSIIVNHSPLSVAAIGLKNMVVVTTDDAVLVMDRSKLPYVKEYLAEMRHGGMLPGKIF